MANAWDVGSARILASLGFEAIATTSSGHAASLGRLDQRVTLEELLAHVRALVDAVDVPVSVDGERCFADDAQGVAATVERIADTGAAGVSIEDYEPDSGIDPIEVATERVAAAGEVTRSTGMVLTARAENHLYGVDDLEDTITRLIAYRQAGADVVYAPWLADIGVRRVSTGGALAFAAYGAMTTAARELLSEGTSTYIGRGLSMDDRQAAFDG